MPYAEELRELADSTEGSTADKDQAVAERVMDWIDAEENEDIFNKEHQRKLEDYYKLTDDDFHYVQELIRVYNAGRCYFVREIVSPSFVKLIQSDRLERRIEGSTYGWAEVKETILKQLVDVSIPAKLHTFTNDLRKDGSSAKLWISRKIKQRAQLMQSGKVDLDDEIYVAYAVSQISADEQRVFGTPAAGDDLSSWNLAQIKALIDAVRSPPRYKFADSPLSRMVKNHQPAERNDKDKSNDRNGGNGEKQNDKKKGRNNSSKVADDTYKANQNGTKDHQKSKTDRRPVWERPSAFPPELREPTGKSGKIKQLGRWASFWKQQEEQSVTPI